MKFLFLNPRFFSLLIPLFIGILFFYKKKNKSKVFSAFKDLEKIYKWDSFFYKLYFLFIFLFFVSIIFFLANPVIETKKEKINREGVDIEIVLDISYSMIAEDLKPNRLEVAKNVIKKFLEKLDYARIGMIVFAWRPFNFFPLNADFEKLKQNISSLNTDTINQNISGLWWTALWDAMLLASSEFNFENRKWNIIILITDGEANKWEALRPILKYIISKGIKVYTIWIWWLEPTYIDLFDVFFGFQRISIWALDEETLKKISLETWWKYFRVINRGELEQVFEKISKEERKMIKFIDYNSLRSIAFIFSLLFLLSVIILRMKKFRT